MASKCSSKLARWRPPSASPNSLGYSLQVYLQTCLITTSKFARSWSLGASTHSLDHGLQVHLQNHSITFFKCIFKLAWLRPRSASLSSLEGERIWRDSQAWWTTQIAWIYEARQECMRPRAGKDRVCISYNEMMSIYPRVPKIYCLSLSPSPLSLYLRIYIHRET